jgi:hypothetical protein
MMEYEDFPFDYTSHEEDDSGGDHEQEEKGSTGRWTREEHHLFVKGLEMYGKGWKKIAEMVKTRTVVQIRTVRGPPSLHCSFNSLPHIATAPLPPCPLVACAQHAQKFFLKIAKAKQNGEYDAVNEGKGLGGGRRKRRRHLCGGGPVAVAPPLLPFVQQVDDVKDGLYNFLSPPLLPSTATVTEDGGTLGGPLSSSVADAATGTGLPSSLSLTRLGLGSCSSFGRYRPSPPALAPRRRVDTLT